MYLKSLEIKNYRKFDETGQKIEFAHTTWDREIQIDPIEQIERELKVEQYISRSSSLIVGKNNSGKSTIVKLLDTLQKSKCGSRKIFCANDFNLHYLRKWYENYIFGKTEEEIKNISSNNLPYLEFEFALGIDDENDIISNFEDVLIIDNINLDLNTEEIALINILIRYEVADEKNFLKEISQMNHQNINEELQYRKFLKLFSEDYYILNFYPNNSEEPAKTFSLSSLLKVKTIEANTVKNSSTLSNAYNKLVNTYVKNNDMSDINETIDGLNGTIKTMVDNNIVSMLERAVNHIESNDSLQINLYPNINLEKIFANNILYEYKEGQNYIPENQFGMGYTNLMVIVANIVDYIELYSEHDKNSAINILCVEEPETFMHPQMQELFIKYISKTIAALLNHKQSFDTFQIIFTTHSSHILNSKIYSGGTLDNIIYLGFDNNSISVKNIKNEKIVSANNIDNTLEYIMKYLRLELSDIFYAQAIVFVEGPTEELYIKYLIDNDDTLRNYHIKVYTILGAHMHRFVSLLKELGIKTIIFSDLDLKRTDDQKSNHQNIIDLIVQSECINDTITTNESLIYFITQIYNIGEQAINNKINELIGENQYLKICNNNIHVFSQGKINGNYATSLEEAIILTNLSDDECKKNITNLLTKLKPKTDCCKKPSVFNSYECQQKLSKKKTEFTSMLIEKSIMESSFYLKTPEYIEKGLETLKEYFQGSDYIEN